MAGYCEPVTGADQQFARKLYKAKLLSQTSLSHSEPQSSTAKSQRKTVQTDVQLQGMGRVGANIEIPINFSCFSTYF